MYSNSKTSCLLLLRYVRNISSAVRSVAVLVLSALEKHCGHPLVSFSVKFDFFLKKYFKNHYASAGFGPYMVSNKSKVEKFQIYF